MAYVSIIIVSWNAREYLLSCLESVKKEVSGLDHEIIVVDNASEDGSPQAVRALFPEVKLIEPGKNLGFAGGNNAGIRVSTGDFLFLINSDVVMLDGCVKNLLSFMEENTGAGIAGPKVLNPDSTLQRTVRKFPTLRESLLNAMGAGRVLEAGPLTADSDVDILSGCFWAVRREALESVGLLDEDFFMYSEDKDWCRRFHGAGWRVMYHPGAIAVHYGGASSSCAPVRFYIEMQRANMQYWEKHHGRLKKALFATILFLHQTIRAIAALLLIALTPAKRKASSLKLRRSVACLTWLVTGRFQTL